MTVPRILIAGIGNIFHGDDAFGVEVLRRILQQSQAEGIHAVDFGIRGFDLACALLDEYDVAILVDATARGGKPGTLYVIEPELLTVTGSERESGLQGHALDPARVLQWVQMLGGRLPALRLVGCEPATFGDDDDPRMELSPLVAAAVEGALPLIQSLIDEFTAEFV
ncbi:MAG TPA: hydrogenase maturation protease [Planctomycetaceae bacterium]